MLSDWFPSAFVTILQSEPAASFVLPQLEMEKAFIR